MCVCDFFKTRLFTVLSLKISQSKSSLLLGLCNSHSSINAWQEREPGPATIRLTSKYITEYNSTHSHCESLHK